MAHPAQGNAPPVELFASEQFMHMAYAVGAERIEQNDADIDSVVRAARATDTIEGLGGIALLAQGETELMPPSSGSQEVARRPVKPPITAAITPELALFRLQGGIPVESLTWGAMLRDFARRDRRCMTLGLAARTQPEAGRDPAAQLEQDIALALFDASASLQLVGEVTKDREAKGLFGLMGAALDFASRTALTPGTAKMYGALGGFARGVGDVLPASRHQVGRLKAGQRRPVRLSLP